jgi:membrane-bound metal-dependent hydrolase YbcI (DUF457 family)
VYSVSGGLIASLAAMLGALLPDVLELGGIVPHRTITHYIWFWVAACLSLWMFLKAQGFHSLFLYCSFFWVSGGLIHVVLDALSNGGIPWVTPYGPSRGLALYRTGDLSEEMTALGLVGLFVGFAWYRGCFQTAYLSQQLDIVAQVFGNLVHF